MSTQTEFDNNISQEQPTIEKDIYSLYRQTVYTGDISHPISISIEEFEQRFKQAVDTYVIGEDLPQERFEIKKIAVPKGVTMIEIPNSREVTRNNLKVEQRLALWGDK